MLLTRRASTKCKIMPVNEILPTTRTNFYSCSAARKDGMSLVASPFRRRACGHRLLGENLADVWKTMLYRVHATIDIAGVSWELCKQPGAME